MFAAKFHDRRIDLLGVGLVGTFTGLGGSLLRDGFLNVVPAALSNNWYLTTAVVAALVGMLLERLFTRLDPFVIALDALTVGLYAAIGMTKALGIGMPAIPSMFVGVAAAVGGSALRDIFLGLPIALMQVGSCMRWPPSPGPSPFSSWSATVGAPSSPQSSAQWSPPCSSCAR
ncbi:trimeric intracellular cation channel family protein [Rhodococcus koreensis]